MAHALRALMVAMMVLSMNLSARCATEDFKCATACGDYQKDCKTVCADSSCNAKQANYGGNLLVLDITSFTYPKFGATKYGATPASCCDACKNTTGCNTWVSCNQEGGCGSGCSAYVSNKPPLPSAGYPLPITMFGSFSSCNGDKWPQGMCSLKNVKDTSKPPSNGPAEGWVSGVVPKPQFDPKCPKGVSQAHCKMCLASKNSSKCFACINTVKRLVAWDECGKCASLSTGALQDQCINCLKTGPSAGTDTCSSCLTTGSSSNVDSCFKCVMGVPAPANATDTCPSCFDGSVTQSGGSGTDACLKCIANTAIPAAAKTGCPDCASWTSPDHSGCQQCLTRAKNVDDARGCTSCAGSNVQDRKSCYDCLAVVKVSSIKWYCGSVGSSDSAAYRSELTACLARAKDSAGASDCSACTYQNGTDADKIKKCLNGTN